MLIDPDLAQTLVREALFSPYRQIEPMRTDRFVRWLKERGISVGDWETLHHLWHVGILHPVAVRDVADDGTAIPILKTVDEERLLVAGEAWGGHVYADLGVELADDASLRTRRRISVKLRHSLLWHPFHLWVFHNLDSKLRRSYDWSRVLEGTDRPWGSRRDSQRRILDDLRYFVRDEFHRSYPKLLALLLEIEPLVHSKVFPRVTLDPFEGDIRRYYEWRNSQVGYHALASAGLSISEVENWHQLISIQATYCDPVQRFRKLLRHADRDERDHLKGDALRAHTLYDMAEILRRYLEVYHWHLLPEETDLAFPEQSARVNLERYGSSRVTNYRRDVVRRIARRFGVDPSYPTYLFLEGPTEVGFVQRWAENVGLNLDRVGIRLVSLGGISNIEVFEDQLRRLREDEVFALVCVDNDPHPDGSKRTTHIKLLEKYQQEGLLPVDFEVWNPNFVQHNFTNGEIVEIANRNAEEYGLSVRLTVEEVEQAMAHDEHGKLRSLPKTLEETVNGLAHFRTGEKLVRKGERWGASLADWAVAHEAPTEKANDKGLRPIEAVIAMALRGRYSNYSLTAKNWQKSRGEAPPDSDK